MVELLDNIFIHSNTVAFSGTHQATHIVNIGEGVIELQPNEGSYPLLGSYTSEVIYTQPFRNLVISWNVDTPAGTHTELEARVMLTDATWSAWMSWGVWGRTIVSTLSNTSDDYVKVDADTLMVKGTNGEEATALQYRVSLHSQDSKVTPSVRLVAGTMRNTLPGRQLNKIYDRSTVNPNLSVDLAVPQYSQYRRDPQFAHGICSPTCVTMVMEYFGVRVLVEEVVRATWDKGYGGYGNWSFNAAVAASYGFSAHVAYYTGDDDAATLDLVRLELAQGQPIITSVRYRNSPEVDRNLPVLDDAPIPSTPGHLVLIRGIIEKDGVQYLIVNDPAAPDDATVRREYRADQFLAAWSNRVAYIIRPQDFRGRLAVPQHIAASFEPTGNNRDNNGIQEAEFILKDVQGNVVSLSNNDSRHCISIVCCKDGGPITYIAPKPEDTVWFSTDIMSDGCDFTILYNAGKVYRARLL